MDLESPNVGSVTWRDASPRYYKYSHWLAERFGGKVLKACLDAGLGCPHRCRASAGPSGCIFCDGDSFTPTQGVRRKPIAEQVSEQIGRLSQRHPQAAYLAYFQAGTNTHAPVRVLRAMYTEALQNPRVVGLIVGTRPDCVSEAVLDLLTELAQNTYVAVEYGMQSSHDRSLAWMNRGHDAAAMLQALAATRARGLDVGTHIILGLPGEGWEDLAQTARVLNAGGVHDVKIHNLYVTPGTKLHAMWQAGEFTPLTRQEYMEQLRYFLERLAPEIVIGRLVGDVPAEFLVAPAWTKGKRSFINDFEAYLLQTDSWQGKYA